MIVAYALSPTPPRPAPTPLAAAAPPPGPNPRPEPGSDFASRPGPTAGEAAAGVGTTASRPLPGSRGSMTCLSCTPMLYGLLEMCRPSSRIEILATPAWFGNWGLGGLGGFGYWVLDFGFWIQDLGFENFPRVFVCESFAAAACECHRHHPCISLCARGDVFESSFLSSGRRRAARPHQRPGTKPQSLDLEPAIREAAYPYPLNARPRSISPFSSGRRAAWRRPRRL